MDETGKQQQNFKEEMVISIDEHFSLEDGPEDSWGEKETLPKELKTKSKDGVSIVLPKTATSRERKRCMHQGGIHKNIDTIKKTKSDKINLPKTSLVNNWGYRITANQSV